MAYPNEQTKFNIEGFIAHLREKWGDRTCPMCRAAQWEVHDVVFEMRQFQGGNFVIGTGPVLPVVPVTCGNCGNTVMVNSIVAGVTPKEAGS
jgi:hypothetical protein